MCWAVIRVARIVGGRGDSSAGVSSGLVQLIIDCGCIPPQILAYWSAEILAFSSTVLSAINVVVLYDKFDRGCTMSICLMRRVNI